jgi:hypothetical protein
MSPKQFLIIGGVILVLLGIAGLVLPDGQILGDSWYLTSGENVAHLVLGVVALAAVYVPGLNSSLAPYYKPIVILVGIIALFFGVYGFLVADTPPLNTFGLANLENPYDNILHLVVGFWALAAAFVKPSTKASSA